MTKDHAAHSARNNKWNKENRERMNFFQKRYRADNPEKHRAAKLRYKLKDIERYKIQLRRQSLKKSFGVSLEWYEMTLLSQNGVCKICGSTNKKRRLSVDHCHKTKKIRGLLCGNCNVGLGNFKDDPKLMAKAIEYLEAR